MPPAALDLRLFGPLSITLSGVPVARLRTRSVGWLLALLVLRHDRLIDRSWLAGTLWPESAEGRALHNLRDDLVHLRRALGPEAERVRTVSRDRLLFTAEGAEIDVLRFDRCLAAGDEASLRRAVAEYTGPLLEGCLEEWAAPEREARAAAYLGALETLAEAAERRGEWAAAQELLRRAEEQDPLRDSLQRGLLRVLSAAGDVPAAIHAYREYRVRLHRELNAEPDPETTRLFQEIRARAREVSDGSVRERVSPAAPPPGLASFSVPESAAVPHPLTGLVGREAEVAEVGALLDKARLVTVVGGGGLGKTRLAIEVARHAGAGAGAAFVPLAALMSAGGLAPYVAAALGLDDPGTEESSPTALIARIGRAELLLVLDNCEHLVEAAAELAQALLERCPRLRILATSRQRLGVMGETVWRIPSLDSPDPDTALPDLPALLERYPAPRLLLERMRMVRPGFRAERPEDVRAIAQICRRLDGIPLALELAAARAAHHSPEQIAARLDDRFRLLSGGNRGTLPRHRTLQTLIDWSYDLLTERQRVLLRRLAVFSGGWTQEAAEAVCSGAGAAGEDLAAEEVWELLIGLVDQSLVLTDGRGPEPRYYWLETLREYARARLRSSGEGPTFRRRHRDHFLALAEAAEAPLEGREQAQWLERLQAEYGNLQAALFFCREEETGAVAGLRLSASLWRFWSFQGHTREGCEHVRAALTRELPDAAPETLAARAKALFVAAVLSLDQGASQEALSLYEASLALWRELDMPGGILKSLIGLGNTNVVRGRAPEARGYYEQALEIARREGNRRYEAMCLGNLGAAAVIAEEYPEAARYYREARAFYRAEGNAILEAAMLIYLGMAMLGSGDLAEAAAHYAAAVEMLGRYGSNRHTVEAIELGAALHSARGETAAAARLYGAAEALRRSGRLSLTPAWTVRAAADLAAARAALGPEGFEAALAEGRELLPEEALGTFRIGDGRSPISDW